MKTARRRSGWRILFWITFGLVAVVALAPGIAYVAALAHVEGRPDPADPKDFAQADLAAAWHRCERSPAITMRRLDPWMFTLRFFNDLDLTDHSPGEGAAWRVAAAHNIKSRVQSGLRWHFTGAALTIWITRNWSAEQVAATLVRDDLCPKRQRP